jgi:hypothetical protein
VAIARPIIKSVLPNFSSFGSRNGVLLQLGHVRNHIEPRM